MSLATVVLVSQPCCWQGMVQNLNRPYWLLVACLLHKQDWHFEAVIYENTVFTEWDSHEASKNNVLLLDAVVHQSPKLAILPNTDVDHLKDNMLTLLQVASLLAKRLGEKPGQDPATIETLVVIGEFF